MDAPSLVMGLFAGASLGAVLVSAVASGAYERGRHYAEQQAAQVYDACRQRLTDAHDSQVQTLREEHSRTCQALLKSEQQVRHLQDRIRFLVACDRAAREHAGQTLQQAVEEVQP